MRKHEYTHRNTCFQMCVIGYSSFEARSIPLLATTFACRWPLPRMASEWHRRLEQERSAREYDKINTWRGHGICSSSNSFS